MLTLSHRTYINRGFIQLLASLAILSFVALPSRAEQPNIVLINLDDADREMFRPDILAKRYPNLNAIARGGKTFTNFHVVSPLCGPSRACLIRGQYGHAIGVRVNDCSGTAVNRGFEGDAISFRDRGLADDDFGKWMQDAGYHTIMVGKYLNGVFGETSIVPAGWNDFYRSYGSRYYDTFRFTTRWRPEGDHERIPEGEYRTEVEGKDVARLIRHQKDNDKALFVYFAPFGPHSEGESPGGMIDDQFRDIWPHVKQEQTEQFNELDISDKPGELADLPLLNNYWKDRIRAHYRERLISIKSLDIALGRIKRALEDTGRLSNTYIMVTSDNGFLLGQHRLFAKSLPLSLSTQVPFIVHGPGIRENSFGNHLLSSVDIAPTLLDLAGAESKPFFDGKSFAPLLVSDDHAPGEWRDAFLVENWQAKMAGYQRIKTTYVQLRMYDSSYTEWADGSVEFYDLSTDPLELQNLAATLTDEEKKRYASRIKELRRPTPVPLITIERPVVEFAPAAGPPFLIKGVAEDSAGVKAVRVLVQKISTREFWTGTDWQSERATIKAELKNPNGVCSDWECVFSPPPPDDFGESYRLLVRTYSSDHRYSITPAKRRFRYDSLPPNTLIENCEVNGSGQIVVSGQSSDNYGVSKLRVTLRNESGQFLKLNEFIDETSHRIIKAEEGQWSWTSPELPSGTYHLTVMAQDVGKNWEVSPPEKTVIIP